MTSSLDAAFAAIAAASDEDAARLRFYAVLADTPLFLLLDEEPVGESVTPALFDLGAAQYVLVFDSEERLSSFVGSAAPYASLSGRGLVEMIAGEGIGLGLNLEVAPSSTLLPPEAVTWLAATLAAGPTEASAKVVAYRSPSQLPAALLSALEAKLSMAGLLAEAAKLVAVEYEGGAKGHLLAFWGVEEGAEPMLASSVNEALIFSGLEAGALDVTFLASEAPVFAEGLNVALGRPALPEPEAPKEKTGPGMDPGRPPILRSFW